jgi:hypothetical protein
LGRNSQGRTVLPETLPNQAIPLHPARNRPRKGGGRVPASPGGDAKPIPDKFVEGLLSHTLERDHQSAAGFSAEDQGLLGAGAQLFGVDAGGPGQAQQLVLLVVK